MAMPYDSELTRLKASLAQAKAAHEVRKQDEAAAREDMVTASVAYWRRAFILGYCGACEKKFDDCTCMWYGAPLPYLRTRKAKMTA